MLGIYRTFLAIMVVFQHLGGASKAGSFSVFAFFVISGYLMTYILKENYGFSTTGKLKYLFNRFLRIFPPYWWAFIFSLLLIFFLDSEVIRGISKSVKLPVDLENLLRNIFILFERRTRPRMVPPAWALTVEIFYYLLMALGISRSKKSTLVWLTAGLIYTAAINLLDMEWHYVYFFFAAGSLPF